MFSNGWYAAVAGAQRKLAAISSEQMERLSFKHRHGYDFIFKALSTPRLFSKITAHEGFLNWIKDVLLYKETDIYLQVTSIFKKQINAELSDNSIFRQLFTNFNQLECAKELLQTGSLEVFHAVIARIILDANVFRNIFDSFDHFMEVIQKYPLTPELRTEVISKALSDQNIFLHLFTDVFKICEFARFRDYSEELSGILNAALSFGGDDLFAKLFNGPMYSQQFVSEDQRVSDDQLGVRC